MKTKNECKDKVKAAKKETNFFFSYRFFFFLYVKAILLYNSNKTNSLNENFLLYSYIWFVGPTMSTIHKPLIFSMSWFVIVG